ncbi:hypothetical protein [Yinghuangia sp. YIM S09857]|uniref:hypothetical protein n=1 Tax=Yinghuangia sp. YIM S09857 TaxID=3436929 RepID=UPI003F530574
MDPNRVQHGPHLPSGRSPWITVAATAVAAVLLVGGLVSLSDGGSGTAPLGGGPPTLPPGMLPTTASTKLPAKNPGAASATPTRPSRTSTSTAKSTAPTNDWNTASGDKKPFTAAEWFPERGPLTIQGRPYIQHAQDKTTCLAAERGMRSMFGDDCIGIVRSLWSDSAKKYVGALSVVSLTDKRASQSIANRLSAGQSDGQYVAFISPPSGSGVRFSEQYRSWVGSMPSGHYLVIVEIVRSDGGTPDSTAKTMYEDLFLIAKQHISAVTVWGG